MTKRKAPHVPRPTPRRPLTKKRIGVLMGGQSSEREVSLRTGQAVHRALVRRGYDAVAIDVDASLIRRLRAKRVGIAFLALHGPGGEDGTMQGLLESLGLPYTGSGVRASAIAMHKATTKALLAAHGVPVAPGTVLRSDDRRSGWPRTLPAGLTWPVVVKPAAEGSTIGVSIVRRPEDWRPALKRAYDYDREALVEAYIPGRTRYLCPAPLPPAVARTIKDLALRAYQAIGCEGAARVDFRITPRGRPYVLEINTIPGMTETSLLPMAAAKAGLDYDVLTERILQSALRRTAAGLNGKGKR